MTEAWKDIFGYDGMYQVSNKGRVRSYFTTNGWPSDTPRIKALDLNKNGYFYVPLYKKQKRKLCLVSRLVAKAFVDNPDKKPNVNHKDAKPKNNLHTNLEWCTQGENVNHAKDAGLLERDKEHGSCKLSRNDVLDIRNAYKFGCFSQSEIGEAYGIDQSAVSYIINKKRWGYL